MNNIRFFLWLFELNYFTQFGISIKNASKKAHFDFSPQKFLIITESNGIVKEYRNYYINELVILD